MASPWPKNGVDNVRGRGRLVCHESHRVRKGQTIGSEKDTDRNEPDLPSKNQQGDEAVPWRKYSGIHMDHHVSMKTTCRHSTTRKKPWQTRMRRQEGRARLRASRERIVDGRSKVVKLGITCMHARGTQVCPLRPDCVSHGFQPSIVSLCASQSKHRTVLIQVDYFIETNVDRDVWRNPSCF